MKRILFIGLATAALLVSCDHQKTEESSQTLDVGLLNRSGDAFEVLYSQDELVYLKKCAKFHQPLRDCPESSIMTLPKQQYLEAIYANRAVESWLFYDVEASRKASFNLQLQKSSIASTQKRIVETQTKIEEFKTELTDLERTLEIPEHPLIIQIQFLEAQVQRVESQISSEGLSDEEVNQLNQKLMIMRKKLKLATEEWETTQEELAQSIEKLVERITSLENLLEKLRTVTLPQYIQGLDELELKLEAARLEVIETATNLRKKIQPLVDKVLNSELETSDIELLLNKILLSPFRPSGLHKNGRILQREIVIEHYPNAENKILIDSRKSNYISLVNSGRYFREPFMVVIQDDEETKAQGCRSGAEYLKRAYTVWDYTGPRSMQPARPVAFNKDNDAGNYLFNTRDELRNAFYYKLDKDRTNIPFSLTYPNLQDKLTCKYSFTAYFPALLKKADRERLDSLLKQG